MKKIIVLLFVMFAVGCSVQKDVQLTKEGSIEWINIDTFIDKNVKGETFLAIFSLRSCATCQYVESFLEESLDLYGATMYKIELEEEPLTPQENVDRIAPYVKRFGGTPEIYLMKQGRLGSRFLDEYPKVSPENLRAWMKNHKVYNMK